MLILTRLTVVHLKDKYGKKSKGFVEVLNSNGGWLGNK